MPPIHGSVVVKWRVLPIIAVTLLAVAVGCGRRRENLASAPAPESKSASADLAAMDRDGAAEVADNAAPPVSSAPPASMPSTITLDSSEIEHEFNTGATTAVAEVAAAAAPSSSGTASKRSIQRAQAERVARREATRARVEEASRMREQAELATTAKVRASQARADSKASTPSIGAAAAMSVKALESAKPDSLIVESAMLDAEAASAEHEAAVDEPMPGSRPANLTAGATLDETKSFTTVPVYYATDRRNDHVPLSAYEVTGNRNLLAMLGGSCLMLILASALLGWLGRTRLAATSSIAACATGVFAAATIIAGGATIEKHGVTYTGDRGSLTRGICEVTVPKVHQPGIVERPSLLRFEFREDQEKHIVLTSAVELSEDEFHLRLSQSIAASTEQDLLVFIHGYNVDFQSAVRRTAQIAVDLPFEGVPVCYTWPSQGSLLGYSIDETNAEWTTAHLKQFLIELVEQTDAKSINVIAHSMGNRPMTAAMEQIGWQLADGTSPMFDRVVLAAPDVDADRFRRDLGPSLLKVANHVTLYASSDDQALIASKQVHGYPRAGESGDHVVVVPGVETIDVSGIDLSLLGHSYYGDSKSMLRDLYEVVRSRLSAPQRPSLITRQRGELVYWQLALKNSGSSTR